MTTSKRVTLAFGLFLCYNGLNAQESAVAAGGKALGDGGSLNYTVGQVSYLSSEGAGGSLSEGVQQAYEIYINVGVEETDITLSVIAFPNPTRDQLSLQVSDGETRALEYRLFDMEGRQLNQGKFSNETSIDMSVLPAAPYLLQVLNDASMIKSFQIIKH